VVRSWENSFRFISVLLRRSSTFASDDRGKAFGGGSSCLGAFEENALSFFQKHKPFQISHIYFTA
jgi:hypothetical protein